ncbi:MAG: alpha/beta fold hydrolase [Gaiellaceae bacterium]
MSAGAASKSSGAFSVDVSGGRLVGWQGGDGMPALVLHGGPLSDYTAPLVTQLPGSLRTIRYQQRGLPPSTLAKPYTVAAHVEDAVRVLDALEIERAWAIGHSWGGHLAFHLAVTHPERLLGVVAIDPLGAVPDGGWGDLECNLFERLELRSPEGAARARELDRRAMAGEASDEEALESLRLVWPFYFARPEAAPSMPEFDISVELYAGVVASVYEHFERGTLAAALPRYGGPFLLVHGELGPLPLAASQATAALVPQAVVEPIAGAGHFPWLERPDEFSAVLASFVRRGRPA